MKIGIISDGKYGERAFKNIKKRFTAIWILVPDIPPNIILDDDINLNIPDCDLYLSYVRHPDIILELASINKPLILGILPGHGLLKQAQAINPKVIAPITMCSLEPNTGIPEIDEFAQFYGKPIYNVELDNHNTIQKIHVIRSSPCGSSEAGAKFILNKKLSIKNLQEFALQICHECRAPRFGHTCDKEISGILHILCLWKSLKDTNIGQINGDLNRFFNKMKQEFKTKIDSIYRSNL